MQILNLKNVPILEQLRLEEALLRADASNWCLINTGAPPAIVMGISGKPGSLLDLDKVRLDKIPVIRRFSGGGTVYIDPKTVFVTFICNSADFKVPAQPKPILEWTETLYRPLIPGFSLRENDYVIGERKCGGNAQYIQKERFLHHTSFLWDFEPQKMEYLLLPERRPAYRENRSHTDFLCTLRPLFPTQESFINTLLAHLMNLFQGSEASIPLSLLEKPHRKVSSLQEI